MLLKHANNSAASADDVTETDADVNESEFNKIIGSCWCNLTELQTLTVRNRCDLHF